MRGSGDECVDLMFFLVCLIFFIGCRCARSPDVVSSLVSSVRPVGRLVLSILSSLVACSYRSYSFRPFVSSGVSFPRLVLIARLVFLFIRLIALRVCDEMFLRDGVLPYHPDELAARSLPRLFLAYLPRNRDAVSVLGLRHPVMRRREDGKA